MRFPNGYFTRIRRSCWPGTKWLFTGWLVRLCALVVRNSLTDPSIWKAVVVYVIGLVSCYVAAVIVGAFYVGGLYRMINLGVAAISFVTFSIWPSSGVALYGWFFDLVSRLWPYRIFAVDIV